MHTFFEMIREAQSGTAADLFFRQFGASPEETAKVVSALMPAFALGLEKSAQRPDAMAELTRLMTKSGFGGMSASPQAIFSQQAIALGEEVMSKLFGSPALAKAIAEQASAMSGVAQESVAKIMPVMAATMIDAMAQAARSGAESSARAQPAAKPKSKPAQKTVGADNPWEAMFATMMGAPEKPAPEPEPEPEPRDPAHAAAEDAFAAYAKLVDAGREMQDAQLKMMKAMMDAYLGKKG